MRPTCFKMESMPINVMPNDNCNLGNWLIRFIMQFAIVALFVPGCRAQGALGSTCDHSTVSDAWGDKFASDAERFLAELQRIVNSNDRAKFAALVHYPIQISIGGSDNIRVATLEQFIQRYPSIVTEALKKAILNQDPKCLFANGQGVMIGHGQLWFSQEGNAMKIIAITLD